MHNLSHLSLHSHSRPCPVSPLSLSSIALSLPAYLSPSQTDYDTAVSAETELCFREGGAPVPCLQCVLIDWIAPAGPSACVWPPHRFSSAKKQMPN